MFFDLEIVLSPRSDRRSALRNVMRNVMRNINYENAHSSDFNLGDFNKSLTARGPQKNLS